MPVEIKELVIRAVAVPDTDQNQENTPKSGAPVDQVQLKTIIQTCVDEILKIMERKQSR